MFLILSLFPKYLYIAGASTAGASTVTAKPSHTVKSIKERLKGQVAECNKY